MRQKLADHAHNQSAPSSFFLCQELTFILNYHVCDGKADCVDGEDESDSHMYVIICILVLIIQTIILIVSQNAE